MERLVCGVLMCVGGDEYGKVDVCRVWMEGVERCGWRCVCVWRGRVEIILLEKCGKMQAAA